MIENLLSEIRRIENEESSFNPFDANFGRLENTHSDIIAKLLEPQWGLLDSFVAKMGLKISKNPKIFREKDRIDILIEDGKNAVIIENKIGAPDQSKQLVRYYEKANKRFDNIILVYLTPFGHSPNIDSKEDLDVKLISYQNHILSWLEEWYEENQDRSVADENLKSFVKLYTEQIRKITRNNKYMVEILEKVFGKGNDKYAEEAITLFKAMSSGINLLQINGIKDKIKETIREIVSSDYADGEVTDWYQDKNNGCWQFDDENGDNGEVSFFISDADIYAQRNDEVLGYICCNNFNNEYLQNLLTGNKEGIKQWLKSVYGY